jgi:pimeloyl-ACP methyl ester carboxylesterase
MGAGIVADFCLAWPEYSLSLISAGPWVFGYYSPAAKDLYSVMDSVGKVFKKDGAKAAMEHWIGNDVFSNSFQNAKTKEQMIDIGKDYSFWHFSNKNSSIVVQPLADKQLEKLTLPTLIITSENDLKACREVADLMNEKISKSKMVIMEDAGHCMNMDKPGRFNEIVTDFINDL